VKLARALPATPRTSKTLTMSAATDGRVEHPVHLFRSIEDRDRI